MPQGAEYAVVPGLILSGALCEVDVAFLEWHNDDMKPNGSLSACGDAGQQRGQQRPGSLQPRCGYSTVA